ncbi:MAG: hypothetical protein PF588_07215 [Candidatus Kapabacteria bacterium]|jgi:hypothetical protein|nr:hypothetical protein [Candidatus Kapabacteria bacterium]
MNIFDKIIDLFLFRDGSDEDSRSTEPKVTVGSIVWGVMLRTTILLLVSTFLLYTMEYRHLWWFMLFGIWLLAIYPGWRQYHKFHERMKKFTEDTLCGSCKYFNSAGQLCKIYDEHVSTEHIPCDGQNWEPLSEE